MAKIRVYELAKELDKDNRSLEEAIRGLGIPIKNYMSTLTPDEAERVRGAMHGGESRPTPKRPPSAPPAAPAGASASGGGSGGPRSSSPAPSGGANAGAATNPVIRRSGAEVRRRRAERAEAAEAAEAYSRTDEDETSKQPPAAERPAIRPRTPGAPGQSVSSPQQPMHQTRPAAFSGQEASASSRDRESSDRGRPPLRPSGPGSAPAGEGQAPMARPSRDGGRPHPAGGPSNNGNGSKGTTPPPGEPAEKRVVPAVGTRIELPQNTRRLPGGMAGRLDQPEPRDMRGGRPEAREMRQDSRPGGGPFGSGQALPRREAPRPAGRDVPVAVKPPERRPVEGTPPARPASSGEPTPPQATEEQPGGRRVVRNEAGVIVGAASQRSEPKILGFITLQQRRKKQQVIITDATEEDKRGRASQRKQREEKAQAQGRRRKLTRGKGRPGGPSRVSTVEMSDEKKRLRVDEAIQVSDLAHQMGQKASVVLRTLWNMGMRGVTINNAIDAETAELVAAEFGYTVENVTFQEDEFLEGDFEGEGEVRAPVVTIMGHVDHGKTSLLDYVRKTRVAAGEAGGITQHIGAYKVSTARGDVVFLDTPGHEAFTAMRARGAMITDLVVLVVAADDGVMPTTIEAIKHAREAETPIIVAINKIDKPDANPGRVKQLLMEQSIVGEEFGGDTAIINVSAKTGQGIEELLETLALQAEILELRAHEDVRARGVVLEARIDKGRGTVATVLVQEGTLRKGDIIVANEYSGKVRGLFDHAGQPLDHAGPSTPVEVLGLSGVPAAGDLVNVVENDRDAKALVAYRRELRRRKESVRTGPSIQEMLSRRKIPVLKVVLKADVQGSAQALREALEALSTEKVKVEVIKSEVGQINETDVKYARAGEGVIFGFNVKTTGKAAPVADSEQVPIHTFSVIYDATEMAKELMVGLLEPEYREKEQGEAEVRALFPIPRLGVVAGCRVIKGLIQRTSHVRVVRDGQVLHVGTIHSLRVHKDDVREVRDGFECGIVVDGFPSVREGDRIQSFELEAIPPTL